MTVKRIDQFCQTLQQQLLEGTLKAGDKLPSERALAGQYKTSRPIVREALQRLKSLGLIESHQGGGTFVSQNYGEAPGSPLASLLSDSDDQAHLHAEFLEYRLTLEVKCAALAAERATQQDLQRLERAHHHLRRTHQEHDLEQEAKADARFHLAIAEASHNRVFLHTLQGLFSLIKHNVITNIGGLSSHPNIRARLMHQHNRLFEAIHHRDPDAAAQAAMQHLQYVEEFTQELTRERQRLRLNQRINT